LNIFDISNRVSRYLIESFMLIEQTILISYIISSFYYMSITQSHQSQFLFSHENNYSATDCTFRSDFDT